MPGPFGLMVFFCTFPALGMAAAGLLYIWDEIEKGWGS